MLNDLQEIERLKEERNAIILAHNYQTEDIQEIADFVGDSLELCIKALKIKKSDIMVFCGVDFMAETAAILNPSKKVLIPDMGAKCPMAYMLTAEDIRNAKERYPDSAVVLYVNSLAEAKAEADILCTSANAVQVVESLPHEKILFGPDRNLAWYVSQKLNKEIIPLPEQGHCYVHKMFNLGDIIFLRKKYPDAEIMIHPESDPEVQKFADAVLSTGGMIHHVRQSTHEKFIIGTEVDMITRLKRENPDKTFIPALNEAICNNMKLHTIEKVMDCLIKEEFVVQVNEKVADKAKEAIKRMIMVTKDKTIRPIREEAYVNE
ncbi:MAG: Quinolinate synthase A [Methanobacterium sp. PtaU1.Bin242]|nr:MAG: Quinolinate synthase A [Methanobacterium sp. PtaU1.Bin242]